VYLKTSRSGFGETTFGNCITFTIDGQQNFRLIYEKIKEAKKSIYILNYDLDPFLHLIRGEGNASQSFQITDLVASPCKSESLSSVGSEQDSSNGNGSSSYDNLHSDSKNNNKKYPQYFHNYTLQNLLIQKANQKVDIKIIVWEPRSIIRKLPGIKKRGLEGREKKVQVIKEAAKHAGVENYITIFLDSKAPMLTSGFHEKIIIIDNEIGFCGGQDLSQDKWDTSDHDFDSPLRDSGGDPWHDVQVMVKGPILWDLIYHFNQRWIYSIWKDIRQVKKIVKASSIGSYLSSTSSFILSPDLFADNGDVEITALRTWKQLSEEDNNDTVDNKNIHYGSEGSNSIRSWYDAMLRKAKHSIYIEDQFLFQDKAITRILVNRLREEKNLKMIAVGPMEPNLPGLIFSVLSKESINDINNNLAALRKVGEDRVRTYSLISQHDRLKQRRKQIYVHSKLMIVDDKWITIGSANTDRDGFKDSTEFDLGIVSVTVAQELRVKLWREHLKTDDAIDYFSSSPQSSRYNDNAANLYNFEEGFEAWEKLAEDNGKRVRTHESIRGHVYYYNFQEMNYPPPYQQAKGGNKFRLF
jgi:phosphatidylserine/phosphatidylglycerophosphate/cardiolipin synthase-like enzyme